MEKTTYRYTAKNECDFEKLVSIVLAKADSSTTFSVNPQTLCVVIENHSGSTIIDNIDDLVGSNAINVEKSTEPAYENFSEMLNDPNVCRETLREAFRQYLDTTISMETEHEINQNNLLKEITDLNKRNEELKTERDRYSKWNAESYERANRIKKQIDAIATLIDAINQ